MFHVSTMLPYMPNNPQQVRKAHMLTNTSKSLYSTDMTQLILTHSLSLSHLDRLPDCLAHCLDAVHFLCSYLPVCLGWVLHMVDPVCKETSGMVVKFMKWQQ